MTSQKKSISIVSRVVLGALLLGLPATAAFAGEPEPTTAASADAIAQHYRDQAEQYRALGGVGYKTGLVQRADADAAKYAALAEKLSAPIVATPVRSPEAEHYAELAAQYRAMGGVAYKAGLVQWAEAQQERYESPAPSAALATPQPAAWCPATKPAVRTLACAK